MNTFIDPSEPIFSIADIADKLKVHQRTLRIYDHAQILSPRRTQKNRRKYSLNDLKKMWVNKQIQRENIIKNSNRGRKPKSNNKKAGY